jgi:hypothetical protein
MSRIATPNLGQPVTTTSQVPHDKIAQRAYEKWVKRGRKDGNDVQDWVEAEAELRAELTRGTLGSTIRH